MAIKHIINYKHGSAVVLRMNSQYAGFGQIRPIRESGTMGPIEMLFGTLEYLGDLAKLPKFHHPGSTGRGFTTGRNARVDLDIGISRLLG